MWPRDWSSDVCSSDLEDALSLARENAARLGLSDLVRFQKNNLLENLDERFDLIVANLPYISTQDRHLLSREVLHDPEVALFGGPDRKSTRLNSSHVAI